MRNFGKKLVLILESFNVEVLEDFYKASVDFEEKRHYFKSYFDKNDDYLCSLIETKEFVIQGTTGLKTWPAATFLFDSIQQNAELQGQTIIELGSGTGFLGISLLKRCPVKRLIFTDHHQAVLDVLQENAKANDIPDEKYQVLLLDWENHERCDIDVDIVIGSDIVFDSRIIPSLVKVLKLFLKQAKFAKIANVLRSEETKKSFEECLKEHQLQFELDQTTSEAGTMLLYDIRNNS